MPHIILNKRSVVTPASSMLPHSDCSNCDAIYIKVPSSERGGYTLPNLNVGNRGPQNTLVGPIWRCCGQKTRPPGHFWVPLRPNLVCAPFLKMAQNWLKISHQKIPGPNLHWAQFYAKKNQCPIFLEPGRIAQQNELKMLSAHCSPI